MIQVTGERRCRRQHNPNRNSARARLQRILLRPGPGFYVRMRRDAPLVSALIFQLCPMVMPQPSAVNRPNPADWCRPLDRSPRFGALIEGKRVAVDPVWTSRSLKPVSPEEYAFSQGPVAPLGRGPIPACRHRSSREAAQSRSLPHSLEKSPDGPARAYLHIARHRA
jgi:hypothetical protein